MDNKENGEEKMSLRTSKTTEEVGGASLSCFTGTKLLASMIKFHQQITIVEVLQNTSSSECREAGLYITLHLCKNMFGQLHIYINQTEITTKSK